MTDVKTLMEMGFPKERAEYALNVTNNKGVEAAMEWLLAHADEQIPAGTAAAAPEAATLKLDPVTNEDAAASISVTAAANSAANSAPPKSLKCDNCGRLFKDGVDAQYHALKAGHHDFSESTEEKPPLTEEEKKEQLLILEQRLKEKRIEREQREKADALERERNRIRSGKDMTEAKKRMEEMEMKKILEQRKREKADEKAARERVRAQIETDKAMRKAREQGASYLEAQNIVSSTTPQNNGKAAGSPAGTPTAAAGGSTTPTGVKSPPKEYSETRIQIRLQDGTTLQETFNVKEQLSAVRVFIQMKTGSDAPFALMTTFPRKIFNDDDYEKPLELLGLVPSAVVIMTKSIV